MALNTKEILEKLELVEGTIDTRSYEVSHGGKPGSAAVIKSLGEPGKSTPWVFEIDGKEVELRGTWKEVSTKAKKMGKKVKVLP